MCEVNGNISLDFLWRSTAYQNATQEAYFCHCALLFRARAFLALNKRLGFHTREGEILEGPLDFEVLPWKIGKHFMQ